MNRADNCPLDDNDDQLDSDGDDIGDVCDANPEVVDGKRLWRCNVSGVEIGSENSPAGYQFPPGYLHPCTRFEVDADCDGLLDLGDVLTIISELAGAYDASICFPGADANCNTTLEAGDALYILLYFIHRVILRPCDFYAPP
jgi:hypothetical protein